MLSQFYAKTSTNMEIRFSWVGNCHHFVPSSIFSLAALGSTIDHPAYSTLVSVLMFRPKQFSGSPTSSTRHERSCLVYFLKRLNDKDTWVRLQGSRERGLKYWNPNGSGCLSQAADRSGGRIFSSCREVRQNIWVGASESKNLSFSPLFLEVPSACATLMYWYVADGRSWILDFLFWHRDKFASRSFWSSPIVLILLY